MKEIRSGIAVLEEEVIEPEDESEEGFSAGGLIPKLLHRGRRLDGSWFSVVRLPEGGTVTFNQIDGKNAEINPWNSRINERSETNRSSNF